MNTLEYFPAREADLKELGFSHESTEQQMLSFGVKCEPALPNQSIRVGAGRELDIIAAPLRILPTVWLYDEATRTLFCSDTVSDETAGDAEQRILDDVDVHDVLVQRLLRSFQLKFDWLVRGDIPPIVVALEAIFEKYPVECLAPTRGLLVRGRRAVEAELTAFLAALTMLQQRQESNTPHDFY